MRMMSSSNTTSAEVGEPLIIPNNICGAIYSVDDGGGEMYTPSPGHPDRCALTRRNLTLGLSVGMKTLSLQLENTISGGPLSAKG